MPPKKAQKESKNEIKKKEKLVADLTFGLKNKNKSKKVQKQIQQVTNQVIHKNKSGSQLAKEEKMKQEAKLERERQHELDKLLRASVVQPKAKPGVDPKTILCEYFKRGLCNKGDACKYSHSLEKKQREPEKIDLYSDRRDKPKEDTMDNWDQDKLEKVIEQKHGAKNQGLPPTTIVCKFFLDAVENSKYGWFWQCPNGKSCHYRHALPPGFELKKKGEEKKDDGEAGPSLEEVLEEQRKALIGGTPVTLETFMEWKKKKIAEREEKEKKEKDALRAKAQDSKGRMAVGLTGRDLFSFNPEMFEDDAGAAQDLDYGHREEEEEEDESEASEDENGGEDDGQDDLDEEELQKRYQISSDMKIDESLFAGDADLEDEDESDEDEKEEGDEEHPEPAPAPQDE